MRDRRVARVIDREIAPIWHDRFARLIVRNLPNSTDVIALDIHCGVGRMTAELLARMGASARVLAIEPDDTLIDFAKTKMRPEWKNRVYLKPGNFDDVTAMADDSYNLVVANLVLGDAGDIGSALAEMIRVNRIGGRILATLPLAGSWHEVEDIFAEVLRDAGLTAAVRRLERLRELRPTGPQLSQIVRGLGVAEDDFVIEQERFQLLFPSGREFLFAPVVEHGPLRLWKAVIGKDGSPQELFWRLKEAIDTYYTGHVLAVNVLAGLMNIHVAKGTESPGPRLAARFWRHYPGLDALWGGLAAGYVRVSEPSLPPFGDADFDFDLEIDEGEAARRTGAQKPVTTSIPIVTDDLYDEPVVGDSALIAAATAEPRPGRITPGVGRISAEPARPLTTLGAQGAGTRHKRPPVAEDDFSDINEQLEPSASFRVTTRADAETRFAEPQEDDERAHDVEEADDPTSPIPIEALRAAAMRKPEPAPAADDEEADDAEEVDEVEEVEDSGDPDEDEDEPTGGPSTADRLSAFVDDDEPGIGGDVERIGVVPDDEALRAVAREEAAHLNPDTTGVGALVDDDELDAPIAAVAEAKLDAAEAPQAPAPAGRSEIAYERHAIEDLEPLPDLPGEAPAQAGPRPSPQESGTFRSPLHDSARFRAPTGESVSQTNSGSASSESSGFTRRPSSESSGFTRPTLDSAVGRRPEASGIRPITTGGARASSEASGFTARPNLGRSTSEGSGITARPNLGRSSSEGSGITARPSGESSGFTARPTGSRPSSESSGITARPTEPSGLTARSTEPSGITARPSSESSGFTARPSESSGFTARSTEPSGITARPSSESSGFTARPTGTRPSSEPSGVTARPSAETSGFTPPPPAEGTVRPPARPPEPITGSFKVFAPPKPPGSSASDLSRADTDLAADAPDSLAARTPSRDAPAAPARQPSRDAPAAPARTPSRDAPAAPARPPSRDLPVADTSPEDEDLDELDELDELDAAEPIEELDEDAPPPTRSVPPPPKKAPPPPPSGLLFKPRPLLPIVPPPKKK